jgi:hypothetical protein
VLVLSTFVLAMAVVFLPVLNDFGRSSTVAYVPKKWRAARAASDTVESESV